MFDGFALDFIEVAEAVLRVRHGGEGPPLLLLHGHPRTHTTWWRVAPLLADHFYVVCPDLRGFGQSSKPKDTADHVQSSKRAKAQDCVELMAKLGFERFFLAGLIDRGSYTAFRLAMDHPRAVERLIVMDGVPIIEALERCSETFARLWWHWFFFCQPEKPERAILTDPLLWYGGTAETMGAENFADFHAAIHDPATVHTMIEDYRAGPAVDRDHDAADRAAGRTLQCPLLCLWSEHDDLPTLYGDVLEVWRPWAPDRRGQGVPSGHHMAEEAPEALAKAMVQFFA
jgi:haloacetate dehalogenase